MEPTVDLKQAHQLEIEHLRRHAAQLESSENVALPLQEFHRENREQEYYKELHRLSGNFLESHIGLRVTRLSREQEDLTFYCLSLLEAELELPIKLFVSNLNEVWVEIKILRRRSEETEEDVRVEKRALKFLHLLKERLQRFIATQITWNRMTQ
jgi:hypothetical protein